jgi:hypothetical protein
VPTRFKDPVSVPTAVLDGLETVRESSDANMQDPSRVKYIAARLGYPETAADARAWLRAWSTTWNTTLPRSQNKAGTPVRSCNARATPRRPSGGSSKPGTRRPTISKNTPKSREF